MPNTKIEDQYQEILKIDNDKEKTEKLNNFAYSVRYIDPVKSSEIATEALKISVKNENEPAKAVAKMHIAFSNFLMSNDFPILRYLTEAYNVLSKVNKVPELPIVLNYLGNVYDSYGDYQKGLDFCHQALKLVRENSLKEVEADALSNLGIIYSRVCDFQNSIKNHLESYKIREEINNKPAMASSLNLIARAYSLNDENDKSEEFYNKAIELRKEIDDNALPWSYLGLASLFEKQKKYTESAEYYSQSVKLNKAIGDKRCNLHCFLGLGKIFLETGDSEKAINFLEEALEISKELNAKPVLYEIYKLMADYYEKTGNIEEAYKKFKIYNTLKEEVLNTELHNKLKKQQISFEVEKSQKEAEIYQLRNVELKTAFDEIAVKNKEILESINYARNIQAAVLPPENLIRPLLKDYFILYMPKDIVSGDFYYINKINEKIYIAAVDCTGHGVPGAFMSMLGFSFINEIIQTNNTLKASEILDILRQKVINALRQEETNEKMTRDGMDIAFCVADLEKKNIEYSGGYNSLYLVKNGELEEIKADRMPIGIHIGNITPFTNNTLTIEEGMSIYLCSDGFADQFGGPEFKKFMTKNLKKLMIDNYSLSMADQQEIFRKTITEWMTGHEQTDDILVIGIKF